MGRFAAVVIIALLALIAGLLIYGFNHQRCSNGSYGSPTECQVRI